MVVELLTEKDIYHGILGLILVVISFIIGIKILLKYFELKDKVFLTVGLTYTLLLSPFWGAAFFFLPTILFDYAVSPQIYLTVTSVFLAPALLCWIYSFCILAYKNYIKILMPIYAVICVVFEIFLIVFLIIDPSFIGRMMGPYNSMSEPFLLIFQVFAIISVVSTGVLFSMQSIKSKEPKIKLKGQFLLINFLTLFVATLIDAIFVFTVITMIVIRSLEILSVIEYYLGFFLPDKVAQFFIKSK